MILDHLERADRYAPLAAGIAAALRYLRDTDFTALPDGRIELDGDRLIAIVSRYRTKLPHEAVWESHRRYIDVQFMVRGSERFGYLPREAAPPIKTPYNDAKDVVFYEPGDETLRLRAGHFAIFFPEDVHAPSLADGEPDDVLKVVMKVAVP